MDTKAGEAQTTAKRIRILCFGDSLTAGYMMSQPEHYPYGDTLQIELAHMLSVPLSQIHVDIDGLSGNNSWQS